MGFSRVLAHAAEIFSFWPAICRRGELSPSKALKSTDCMGLNPSFCSVGTQTPISTAWEDFSKCAKEDSVNWHIGWHFVFRQEVIKNGFDLILRHYKLFGLTKQIPFVFGCRQCASRHKSVVDTV